MARLMHALRFPSEDWLQELIATKRIQSFAPPAMLPLSSERAERIAQKLKECVPSLLHGLLDDEARACETFVLEQMVSRLEAFADNFKPQDNKFQRIDAEKLVAACSAAMQLRNRSALRSTVQGVFEQVFPACEVDPATWSKVPSASAAARARLLLDASLCGVMRDRFASLRGSLYMLADSSPQAGHDYMLSTCLIISGENLEKCFQAKQSLQVSWEDFLAAYKHDDTDAMHDIVANRQECAAALQGCLTWHRMLPMELGQGASSLEHKSRALARAFFAETQSMPALQQTLSQVVSITTDLGTELGLADLAGPRLREILPPWLDDQGLEVDVQDNLLHQHADGLDMGQDYFQEYFLPRAIAVPGLNHIVENMCADYNSSMEGWDSWLASLKPLVSMMHHEHLRSRFIATCVRGTAHAWMESRLQRAVPQFAEWRWGSTVKVLERLMPLQKLLQTSWDPGRYQAGMGNDVAVEGEGARGHESASVPEITEAVRSNVFWSFGAMILMLNSVGTRFASWAEGCPCHPFAGSSKQKQSEHSFEDDALVALECCRQELGMPRDGDGRSLQTCPLAGLKAGDLASGAVQQHIEQVAILCKEDLLVEISNISEEETLKILETFEQGKNHILASVSNKLKNWKMMPWQLAALCVPDQTQARETAKCILQDFDAGPEDPLLHHRLTYFWLKLSGSFRSQLEAFAAGEPLNSQPQLCRTVMEMAFIPVAACSVSGFGMF